MDSTKKCKKRLVLPVLVAALGSVLAGQAAAQTFTTIHSFSGGDGAWPREGLTLSGHTLYGTTQRGGNSDDGTVFAVSTDGGGFKDLHSFNFSDGSGPNGGLLLWSNTFYGVTSRGGISGSGTVFKLSTDGTGFANLYSFDGTNGWSPSGQLALSGGIIYGTTEGTENGAGPGEVYALSQDGVNFTNLHKFTGYFTDDTPNGVNLASNTLYGTTKGDWLEGTAGGSVFRLNVDGTGFSTVYDFGEGMFPMGGLILSGDTLYGTAGSTVFKVNTDGTSFATLNAPEAGLEGEVILSGDVIYGTSAWGGLSDNGFVFRLKTDGTGFTILHNFTALQTNSSGIIYNSDGANPFGKLILSGNTLYGTCLFGGSGGGGTIFSISLPPELTITAAGANLVLSWPTNPSGFTLQSTTDLVSPLWTTNLPAPVVVNGQNTVTQPISGTQQFFRLVR